MKKNTHQPWASTHTNTHMYRQPPPTYTHTLVATYLQMLIYTDAPVAGTVFGLCLRIRRAGRRWLWDDEGVDIWVLG